jgi:hypothetical protein
VNHDFRISRIVECDKSWNFANLTSRTNIVKVLLMAKLRLVNHDFRISQVVECDSIGHVWGIVKNSQNRIYHSKVLRIAHDTRRYIMFPWLWRRAYPTMDLHIPLPRWRNAHWFCLSLICKKGFEPYWIILQNWRNLFLLLFNSL